MNQSKAIVLFASFAATTFAPALCRADFHLWYIKEIFSNHDGSVQFIELFTTSPGQENLAPAHTLTSSTQHYHFPSDTPSPTNNRHILIATEGFGSITGGATPNYVIPQNFFDPAGDTINFGEGTSVRTLNATTPIPTDGINSLNWTGFVSAATSTANSPRNHAGNGTSVNLPPPLDTTGDYNGNGTVDAADYTLWRDTFGQNVTAGAGADGDANGSIGEGDYNFWKTRFGASIGGASSGAGSASAPTPEPTTLYLTTFALCLTAIQRAPRRQA